METTRRTVIAGAASALAAPAFGQGFPSPQITRSAGFQGWAPPLPVRPFLPLDVEVAVEDGQRPSLGKWMGPRPTMLILWALWCTPCLAEKKPEDDLLMRLRGVFSRTNIVALQSYDAEPIGAARAMLERLGARNLPLARTTPQADAALAYLTGAQPGVKGTSVSLPAMALVASDGREIGHHSGKMPPLPGHPNWFVQPRSFEMLMLMGKMY